MKKVAAKTKLKEKKNPKSLNTFKAKTTSKSSTTKNKKVVQSDGGNISENVDNKFVEEEITKTSIKKTAKRNLTKVVTAKCKGGKKTTNQTDGGSGTKNASDKKIPEKRKRGRPCQVKSESVPPVKGSKTCSTTAVPKNNKKGKTKKSFDDDIPSSDQIIPKRVTRGVTTRRSVELEKEAKAAVKEEAGRVCLDKVLKPPTVTKSNTREGRKGVRRSARGQGEGKYNQEEVCCIPPTLNNSDNECEDNINSCIRDSISNCDMSNSKSTNDQPDIKYKYDQVEPLMINSIDSHIGEKETSMKDFSNILSSIIDEMQSPKNKLNTVSGIKKDQTVFLSSVSGINDQSLQPVVVVKKIKDDCDGIMVKKDISPSKNTASGSPISVKSKSTPLKNISQLTPSISHVVSPLSPIRLC